MIIIIKCKMLIDFIQRPLKEIVTIIMCIHVYFITNYNKNNDKLLINNYHYYYSSQ